MKTISRHIYPYEEDLFFKPVRDKIDYAKLIALSARLLLLDQKEDKEGLAKAELKLLIDRMSRLFFYQENKYFSIAFPFNIGIENNNVLEIESHSGKPLDHRSISGIISILDNENFKFNPSLIDFYIEPTDIDSYGLSILEEIFLFEPSYIRYDYDLANENGVLHPLNHLDINYSNYGTYKLGINETITHSYFENLQNINTDCSFLR